MASIRVKTDERFTQGGLRLLLCVVLAGCAAIVVAIPTPVVPSEPPSLVVDRRIDRALLERDERLAARAPSDASSRALRAVVAAAGRLEAAGGRGGGDSVASLAAGAQAARSAVVSAHGAEALASLRAAAVLRFVAAYDPALSSHPRAAEVIGGFGRALERWGVVRDGFVVAPPLVVRTLYAARWNAIVGLPRTSGFGDEELRAYHGWLALHVPGLPREARVQSIAAYLEAGGGDAAREAMAMVLFEDRSTVPAEEAFERLYESNHSLRLRNHALAAHVLAR